MYVIANSSPMYKPCLALAKVWGVNVRINDTVAYISTVSSRQYEKLLAVEFGERTPNSVNTLTFNQPVSQSANHSN